MDAKYLLQRNLILNPYLLPWTTFLENLKKIVTYFRLLLYYGFFTITSTLSFIPIYTYFQFAPDLSSINNLKNKKDTGIILLDRNDKPFFTFHSAKLRKEVKLSEIPKHTQQAVISIEDKTFYRHYGFSPKAIVRAAASNFEQKQLKYGASTITQQLAKNSLLTPEKSLIRKYKEIVLASEIERRYSKDQILEAYLNSVYFGKGAFGIEEASNIYFEKKAKDLSLSESAFLASLLTSPSKQSAEKTKIVLQKMEEQGYISKKQADEAGKEKIKLAIPEKDINSYAPHFAIMVRDQLIEKYGEKRVVSSGFKVKTTLNLDFQKFAEETVSKQVENLRKNRVSNGAAVIIDPKTGEILAMVGSADWYNDSFGRVNVALSERPPGSAFKPIVYLKAFEKKLITTATILQDNPTSFANFDQNSFYASFPNKDAAIRFLRNDPNAYYKPVNYDRRFRGPVTVRRALSNSLNVPSVEVMKKVGVNDVVNFAKNVGITTIKNPDHYGLSLVLGTVEVRLLDLTSFYAALANYGVLNEPTAILEIQDKYEKVIYTHQPNSKKVFNASVAYLVTSILSDNVSRKEVFGNALDFARPAAVKTGTTEDYKDAWTLGYTPSLAVGVWVGNNYGEDMDQVAGSLGAAPIWKALMTQFLKGTPVENFSVPDGIIKQNFCLFNNEGKISATITEYFIKDTEPQSNCVIVRIQNSQPTASPQPTPTQLGQTTPHNKKGNKDKPQEN